jgi:hypothetical protein
MGLYLFEYHNTNNTTTNTNNNEEGAKMVNYKEAVISIFSIA